MYVCMYDRSNIRFAIAKYIIAGKKNKEKADNFQGMASLCKNLSDFVADNYAIIYMKYKICHVVCENCTNLK